MSAEPITRFTGIVAPLMRDNVNTDAIIPSREMKSVSREGLADGLFADWRYTAVGGRVPVPGFVLNDPRFGGASILLAGSNFGCGSSREHAAWALAEFGFRAVIAESFNPIFRGNAVLNGIVPVILSRAWIESLGQRLLALPRGTAFSVDLEEMVVETPWDDRIPFTLDDSARTMLRDGLDMIDLTLRSRDAIQAFRDADRRVRPWVYSR